MTLGRHFSALGVLIVATTIALGSVGVGCSVAGTGTTQLSSQAATRIRASSLSGEEGDILVILRPNSKVSAALIAAEFQNEFGIEALGLWKMNALNKDCIVFVTGSDVRTRFLMRRLARDPRVESVQPNQVFRIESVQGNGKAQGGDSEAYGELQYAAQLLGLAEAHQAATGRGVTIGVVDTGVDVTHPELEGKVAFKSFVRHDKKAFTGDAHGTAVVGAIAATADNRDGIVGVAPDVRIEAYKACWYAKARAKLTHAVCSSYTLALALDYAVLRDLDVLNLSLGGPSDPLLSELVQVALDRGTIVVGASDSGGQASGFPGGVEGVIAANACDSEGRLWPPEVTPNADSLTAPGAEVLSLAPGNTYDFVSGSSMAAAHVSGLVALLLEARPSLSAAEVGRVLGASSARVNSEDRLPTNQAAGDADDTIPVSAQHPRIVHACRALGEVANVSCLASPASAPVLGADPNDTHLPRPSSF